MSKHWVVRLGIIALVMFSVYFAIGSIMGTTIDAKNFPLSEKWSARLFGSIQEITLGNNQFVLARTSQRLYALDSESGKILWWHSLNWKTISDPAITTNDSVFIVDGKGIWALKQSDGSVLWTQTLNHSGSAAVVAVFASYVAVKDGSNVNLYQATNGSLLWSKSICRNDIQPHFYSTNIYIPCYGLSALDIISGKEVWEIKSEDRIWDAAYVDRVMYYSPDSLSIMAFDLQDRAELWKTPLLNDGRPQLKVIGEFLFLTDSNQFCVLRRNDGEFLGCAKNRNRPQNPAVVDNISYVFNGPQNVITGFDIISGAQIGQLTINNFNTFTDRQLMISTDNVLIFAGGADIFAFGK